jgi:hypothetical protein
VKVSGERTASIFGVNESSCSGRCSSWEERCAGCIGRLGIALTNKSNGTVFESLQQPREPDSVTLKMEAVSYSETSGPLPHCVEPLSPPRN